MSEPTPETPRSTKSAPAADVSVVTDEMVRVVDALTQARGGLATQQEVAVVDVVAARAAAGSKADVDPLEDPSSRIGDIEPAIGWLGMLEANIDLKQAQVAGTIDEYGSEISVLGTEQPTDEVTRRLPFLGFEEVGGVWVGDDSASYTFLTAGSGLIVATTIPGKRGRRAVSRVRELVSRQTSEVESAAGAVAQRLLSTQPAPAVRLLPIRSDDGPWRCLDAIVTMDSFTDNGGQIVFVPTGDPERVVMPLTEWDQGLPWATYRFGDPVLREGAWWVDVLLDYEAGLSRNSLLGFSDKGGGASLIASTLHRRPQGTLLRLSSRTRCDIVANASISPKLLRHPSTQMFRAIWPDAVRRLVPLPRTAHQPPTSGTVLG